MVGLVIGGCRTVSLRDGMNGQVQGLIYFAIISDGLMDLGWNGLTGGSTIYIHKL